MRGSPFSFSVKYLSLIGVQCSFVLTEKVSRVSNETNVYRYQTSILLLMPVYPAPTGCIEMCRRPLKAYFTDEKIIRESVRFYFQSHEKERGKRDRENKFDWPLQHIGCGREDALDASKCLIDQSRQKE